MSNDQALIDMFVRVSRYPDVIVIFVGDIEWSSHEPELVWVPLIALPADTPPLKVQQRAAAVIKRRRYFAICEYCSERKPQGWMVSPTKCQACTEKSGITF